MIEYPSGLDCVWVASDARDNLAAFVTLGSGAVPKLLLDNLVDLLDYEIPLLTLPVTSEAHIFEQTLATC